MTRSAAPLLPIAYSDEVTAAKARGAAIVALESTIITHGMPYPGQPGHGAQRRSGSSARKARCPPPSR